MIVYADFNCPACYLASRRVDALSAATVEVSWRAVERLPSLAVGGQRLSPAAQDRLSEQFGVLSGLLDPAETMPWAMPTIVPKTEAAVSAYAEAYGAAVGDDVRRLLFELYWRDGVDIGNPAVLRTPLTGPILRGRSDADPLHQSGYAVAPDRGPITTDAYRHIRSWRTQWYDLGRPELPVLLTGGATWTGVDAVRRLGKQISHAQGDPRSDLADARRYPQVRGQPPAAWVSQIGGRWRRLYQLSGAHD